MEDSYVYKKRIRAVASITATKNGDVTENVAPLFYVKSIIRNVETPNGLDTWLIHVNDHNQREFEFELSSKAIHLQTLTAELSENGVMIAPFWTKFVVSHLLYGHQKCQEEGCISYRNKVLGWYPFNGTSYYFYDETDFDGKHAQCARKSIEFQKGDKETYLKFLKDTVFPSTELSLALAIGYSAVVVARLKDEADLGTVIVNLCGTSSTGKSTAEMLMCSPFMNPAISNSGQSLSVSAQSTLNALYQLFEGVYGVPCVVDDITTNSKFTMTDIVYALAQGAPKRRLNGNCEARKSEGWCGVIIVSSESPITDFTDCYQGVKARVLHTYGLPWTKSAEESKLVKRTVRKNFGFTGKEFADYVATIPVEDLYDRFEDAIESVQKLMPKKDNLTDRIADKYAAVYLTVELLNEKFAYGLSADNLLTCFIQPEQDTFEERDNAKTAYQAVIDFVSRNEGRFLEDRQGSDGKIVKHYDCWYRPNNCCGKIIKYDKYWEVHLLHSTTNKILAENGLASEARAIRQKWVERGITQGDGDHNTRQHTYTGVKARYDCFTIQGGIQVPEGEDQPPKEQPQEETPVSPYKVDDSEAIKSILGGDR